MGPQVAYFMPADPDGGGPARPRHRRPRRRLPRRQPRTCCSAAGRTTPGRRPRPARTSSTPSRRSSASPTARPPTVSRPLPLQGRVPADGDAHARQPWSRRTRPTRRRRGPRRSSAQRTVHGIVYKRGTVDGKPVAFAQQRSTYFHEADSAARLLRPQRPAKVRNGQDFQHAATKIDFTFNWFYIDDQRHRYFNSGNNPARPRRVRPSFPVRGRKQFLWKHSTRTR